MEWLSTGTYVPHLHTLNTELNMSLNAILHFLVPILHVVPTIRGQHVK